MATPTYTLNVANATVSKREGAAAVPFLDGQGMPALAAGAGRLTYQQQGTVVKERSDYSHYPTCYSFIHEAWAFTLSSRAFANTGLWLAERYLHDLTFEGMDCTSKNVTLQLIGIMLEGYDAEHTWGELATVSLRGQALQAVLTVHGTPDVTTQLEGNLKINRKSQNEAFPADGDTVNHWNVFPLT